MRLPVVTNISTKDGASNKNARLTNMLRETTKTASKAVVRPGLVLDAIASGVGNGLVVFNNALVSVFGATLGAGTSLSSSAVWALSAGSLGANPVAITYSNGTFFAYCENGNVYLTTDGDTWTESATGAGAVDVTGAPIAASGDDVCFFHGSSGAVYVSHNGASTWASFSGMTWASNGLGSASVFHDGTYFIACFIDGDGTASMGRSSDGETWTQTGDRPAYQTNLVSQFCTDGSVIVACNAGNGAAYSDNHGMTWNDSILQPSEDPYLCAFGNGKFVAIAGYLGSDVNVYTSPDGISAFIPSESTWTYSATLPATSSGGTLSFTGEFFVYTDYTGNFFLSDDAVTWTQYADAVGLTWGYVASGNSLSVAAQPASTATGFLTIVAGSIPLVGVVVSGTYDFAQSPI